MMQSRNIRVRYDSALLINRYSVGSYWLSAADVANGTKTVEDSRTVLGAADTVGLYDPNDPGSGKGYAGAAHLGQTRTSAPIPVVAGEWLAWQLMAYDPDRSQGRKHYAQIRFKNGAGVVLSTRAEVSVTMSGSGNGASPLGEGGLQVPSTASTAEVITRVTTAAGGAVASSVFTGVSRLNVVSSLIMADVIDPQPLAGPDWQVISDNATSIRVVRGGELDGAEDNIDTGMAVVVAQDAALDPARNSLLTRGRAFVVEASTAPDYVPDAELWNAPVRLFTGKLSAASADYGPCKTGKDPIVTLTAADVVQPFRSIPFPQMQGGTFFDRAQRVFRDALPSVFVRQVGDDVGVHVSVNATKWLPGQDSSASAWDQLMRLRNSFAGTRIWPKADGSVVLAGLNTAPNLLTLTDTTGDPTVDGSPTKVDLSYGSDTIVNTLTIEEYGAGSDGDSTTFGPYINAASVDRWGAVSASVDTCAGSPPDLATWYLKRLASPVPLPSSVTVKTDPTTWSGSNVPDLYWSVRLTLSQLGLFNAETVVVGIEHAITPRTWTTTYRLRPPDTQAPDAITTPVAGEATGPLDVDGARSPFGSRYRSAAWLVPNASWTTVPLDGITTLDQVGYDDGNGWLIAPVAGRYLLLGCATFSANVNGRRLARLLVNSTAVRQSEAEPSETSGGSTSVEVSRVVQLAAGDAVRLQAYQSSGADLGLLVGNPLTFLDLCLVRS